MNTLEDLVTDTGPRKDTLKNWISGYLTCYTTPMIQGIPYVGSDKIRIVLSVKTSLYSFNGFEDFLECFLMP